MDEAGKNKHLKNLLKRVKRMGEEAKIKHLLLPQHAALAAAAHADAARPLHLPRIQHAQHRLGELCYTTGFFVDSSHLVVAAALPPVVLIKSAGWPAPLAHLIKEL